METKKMAIIIALVIAFGALISVYIILVLETPPSIPSDENHIGQTTCLSCHETGILDSPLLPSWHFEALDNGHLENNIAECLECHNQSDQ